MVVAVASQDFIMVTGHAGQARHWLVFEEASGSPAHPPRRVELTKEQVFHHWADQGPHPLDGVTVIIAASAGDSFLNRMEKRGVTVVITGETDPARAVAGWRADHVVPPKPRPIGRLICKLHDLFSKHRH
jgi:hypothetical protein